ncbi:MAG TPA: hypothetical protein VGJ46_04170 [Candidatus Limnocylindrales bacterium]|jgi:uncharacterized membrane protein
MDWLQFGVQWLHVLLGIFWFGGTMYLDFILIPALMTLPLSDQRRAGAAIGARAVPIYTAVAVAVILLGILRGTVFGQIKSLDALGTTYGLTWLVALVAAVATAYWGLRILTPAVEKLYTMPDSGAGAGGGQSPGIAAVVADIRRKGQIELLGFFVIFTCMILMRFGA